MDSAGTSGVANVRARDSDMNLFDLVKRQDRSVRFEGTPAVAETGATSAGNQRLVVLPGRSSLRLVDAHEFTALHVLSADLGWALRRGIEASPPLPTILLHVRTPKMSVAMVKVEPMALGDDTVALRLRWPQEVVQAESFDLELANPGAEPISLLCGPLVNMREYLLPHARGKGVEVGPGLHPLVLPGPDVDVSYVEQEDPREWLNLYAKTGAKPELPPQAILERYRRASAVVLDSFAPSSLEFVFSNHVFEHLPNPFQVLANWRRVLVPGGMVLGVLPDPRFTFDCRQPPTTLHEALQEEAAGGHDISLAKYERWCRWTEPKHTPEELVRRKYSIHVNFFSPDSFRDAMHELRKRGWFDRVFIFTAPNHKDFAFALRTASI